MISQGLAPLREDGREVTPVRVGRRSTRPVVADPSPAQLDALRHSLPRRRGPGLTRREQRRHVADRHVLRGLDHRHGIAEPLHLDLEVLDGDGVDANCDGLDGWSVGSADIVIEHVGEATWERSVRSLARGGRLVTCGATTGPAGDIKLLSEARSQTTKKVLFTLKADDTPVERL